METSYEVIKAVKYIMMGQKEDMIKLINYSVNDMFFQMQYIVCSDELIGSELADLYVYIAKNLFLLESADKAADFMNDTVVSRAANWLRKNRKDIVDAEKKGLYTAPPVNLAYSTAPEIEDIDMINELVRALCVIPEIHRVTALAFYYDDMDYERMSECLLEDVSTLKKRIEYVENILSAHIQKYCTEQGLKAKSVNAQRIRKALVELGKLYKYTGTDMLIGDVSNRIK